MLGGWEGGSATNCPQRKEMAVRGVIGDGKIRNKGGSGLVLVGWPHGRAWGFDD